MNRIHLALGLALALPAFAALAQETVAPATEKDGVLVDGKGMTLYTYDKDSEGQSACSGQCEELAAAGSGPGSAGQRRLEPGRSRGRHPAVGLLRQAPLYLHPGQEAWRQER